MRRVVDQVVGRAAADPAEFHAWSVRALGIDVFGRAKPSSPSIPLPPWLAHQEIAFSNRVFATPSGQIELVSDEARSRWGVDSLPDFFESKESGRRDSDRSRKFPLYFMTPNTKNRIHSQFNNLEMIRQLSPEPFVQIHPDDAAERNIADGELARIFNDRGEIQVVARLDWGIKRGCVSVTNGWWITQGGTVNFCSYGRETDMGHGAAFHDNLVQVDKP